MKHLTDEYGLVFWGVALAFENTALEFRRFSWVGHNPVI
jgi:hypothetical protein